MRQSGLMHNRRALLLLVVLINVLLVVLWRTSGATPKSAVAPEHEFSSYRAHAVLRGLLRDGVPHPASSEANARVRDRVIAKFRELGYDVNVQRRFVCSPAATCATIENVIAEAPGTRTGDALLLTVHYDSVPAGPGASDDGTGVATLLEIARAIRGERFRNRVVFLVDDAEEVALLGAEAFVADPALAGPIGAVINLENRGTNGPSYMFETSRRNRWLIAHLGRALEFPVATSLFNTIYDRLPNDTDVTVFKRAGKAAVNFAATGNVAAYHTPNDNVANVSLRTLQHHGSNVLQLARQLANADLGARSTGNAVYFDVLGFFLVQWPEEWTLWIAIASLLVLLVAIRKLPAREITYGVLSFFATVVIALFAGFALSWLARIRGGGAVWTAMPLASIASMWLAGIGAALFAASLFRRRAGERALLAGHAVVWHVMAIALAATLPGASFLFVVPAVVFALLFVLRASETVIALVAGLVAAVLLFPLGVVLYETLGAPSLVMIALLIAISATTWSFIGAAGVSPAGFSASASAGEGARRSTEIVVFAAALILAIVATFLPTYTKSKPRQLNFAYVDDDARAPLWMASAALDGFSPTEVPEDWPRQSRFSKPAQRIDLPRVEIASERAGNIVRVTLKSNRNANRIGLIYQAANVDGVRVNAITPPPWPERDLRRRRASALRSVTVLGTEATIEFTAHGPIDVRAYDLTYGLPPHDFDRDANAVPVGVGDVAITQRGAKL